MRVFSMALIAFALTQAQASGLNLGGPSPGRSRKGDQGR